MNDSGYNVIITKKWKKEKKSKDKEEKYIIIYLVKNHSRIQRSAGLINIIQTVSDISDKRCRTNKYNTECVRYIR